MRREPSSFTVAAVIIALLTGAWLLLFGAGCYSPPTPPTDYGPVYRDDGTAIPTPAWTNEPSVYIGPEVSPQ